MTPIMNPNAPLSLLLHTLSHGTSRVTCGRCSPDLSHVEFLYSITVVEWFVHVGKLIFGESPSLIHTCLLIFYLMRSKHAFALWYTVAPEIFFWILQILWVRIVLVAMSLALCPSIHPACSVVTVWLLHAMWVSWLERKYFSIRFQLASLSLVIFK
jgi:hypothetical protein